MTKYVTRTVISYSHTFIKYDNGFVTDEKKFELSSKLGDRKAAMFKEANNLEGYFLVEVKPIKRRYGVPIDVFMAHAVEIPDDVNNEEKE